MKNRAINLRRHLMLFTACTAVSGAVGLGLARAQTAVTPTPVVVPGDGADSDMNAYQIKKVHILYQKLLLRQKDIPNAVSVLGEKQVQSANPTLGSIQTLLTQTPSVVAYTQQVGQNNPTLAIRGVANNQLAETLDGVPMNDLINGSGNYLTAEQMGSPVTLNEIDGVTVYPGLAPPAKQGFGTTGGTIAYSTKQPDDAASAVLEGGYGSFDTSHFGFVLNSGKIGTGPDAPKVLMLYDQSETAGYVDNTGAHYHDFMLNAVKPYDDGLSQVGMVIIYNQANGLVQTLPAPTALIQQGGYKFNYPTSLGYYNQADQDLTTILSDKTYINQYAIFNGSFFYLHNSTTIDNYLSAPGVLGYTYNGLTYAPNVQGTYNFFGCVGGDSALGYDPGPDDPGTADNPCAEGEADDYTRSHENTLGITPQLTLFPDDHNTIVIGGLLSKASTSSADYLGPNSSYAQSVEQLGYNGFDGGGGEQRTIFSGYAQDTIRLLDNKLQITPGVKVDAAYSSRIEVIHYGRYDLNKLENYTKVGGYYLGLSYNLPDNFVLYGSLGKGSLFAPVGDFSAGVNPDTGLPTPGTNTLQPELVHLYEAGVRYDTPRLLLNVDAYYENISDAFAFYTNFLTDAEFYANDGGELYRGVEGNGQFLITPNLSIFGNFSYNETEYTKSFFALDTLAQDQYGFAFTGTPLSNVPIWNGLVGASYDMGPFSAYATGQYTGREFTTYDLDDGNYSSTNPYNAATVTNTKIQNPANFVVNLLLSYKIPVHYGAVQSVTATLNMQNLLDERYYTYTYSSENPVAGVYDPHQVGGEAYGSAFVGEPRSFLFDLSAKF